MKLSHIFEDGFEASRMFRQLSGGMKNAITSQRADPKSKYVGHGAAAYVDRVDDPHEMDNIRRTSKDTDSTAHYLIAIKNHGMENNPYLPRVLSTKKGGGVIQHHIEKLVPLQSEKLRSVALITGWMERTMGEELTAEYVETVQKRMHARQEEGEEAMVVRLLNLWITEIDEYITGSTQVNASADPAFRKAIDFIHSLHKSEEYGVADLHDENVMWRITGSGPHLVITDPLYNGE